MQLPDSAKNRIATAAAVAAVALAAWLPYREILTNFFVHDDYMWLAMAEKVRVDPWILVAFRPFSPSESLGQFTPATQGLFSVIHASCGKQPLRYYTLAVALHMANALAVFFFARRLGFGIWLRALAAILFAVQFQSCHAVLYLSEFAPRALNLLILACLWCYDSFLAKRSRTWYAMAIVIFLLSMAWHAASVMILPLMLAHKLLLRGPRSGRFRMREFVHLVPFGILLIPYLVFLLNDPAADSEIYGIGFHCVPAIVRTVVAMFLPAEVTSFGWAALLLVAATLLLVIASSWLRAQARLCAYAAVWTVVALLPFAFFFWRAQMAHRYGYTAQIGWAMLAALGIETACRLMRVRWLRISTAVVLLLVTAWMHVSLIEAENSTMVAPVSRDGRLFLSCLEFYDSHLHFRESPNSIGFLEGSPVAEAPLQYLMYAYFGVAPARVRPSLPLSHLRHPHVPGSEDLVKIRRERQPIVFGWDRIAQTLFMMKTSSQ